MTLLIYLKEERYKIAKSYCFTILFTCYISQGMDEYGILN